MTCIPVATCLISRNNLKRHYLKKKKTFSRFFIAFLKCALNLENFEKKMSIPAYLFPKLLTPKEVVT